MSFNRRPNTRPVLFHRSTHLVVLLILILGSSCGPDALEGRVIVSGSSTLAPLLSKTVDQWKKLHPRVEVRVEAIGSDAGLERLIQYNDADLAMISRPLSDQDRQAASALGKNLQDLPVAWDAVSLVVPASNSWAHTLTTAQAARAFTTAELWSDLDPAWPDLPLHRFVLGPQSGTADVFAAALLGGAKDQLFSAPMVQASEEDQILARGLAQVEGSIGFLGWTTVRASTLPLRVLALDGVEPTTRSVQDGTYGLPRELWLVGDASAWRGLPAAQSLVRYFYGHYAELLAQTPLVPLSDQERLHVESTLKQTW